MLDRACRRTWTKKRSIGVAGVALGIGDRAVKAGRSKHSRMAAESDHAQL